MCIILNTFFMAIKNNEMKQSLKDALDITNYCFAFLFNMELVLKLIGLGRTYFFEMWNNFDMFIVLATDVGIFF